MNRFEDHVMPPSHPNAALPPASSQRWQPLRSGLLNIYRYDEETFHFEQGRLLLRGHNGTGKSRVLAMQLPFLFDADILPQRVEPDGDPAKRIEWNLLMNRHADRLGYTWLEFGRRDEEGIEHYFTIGIALHAVAGRGAPTRWYFVLRRGRVGVDLHLRNDRNQPLSRDALIEAIGDAGAVFTDRNDYRRDVDETLFKLGELRYRALMDLLIQLRQPQLSRDLDEKRLSAALSEALPPIEQRIIDDVAESFRGLESDRLALQRSEAAGAATEEFLREYRPYVQCAARRRAASVRLAHADYEQAQRQLREAEAKRDTALASLEKLTAQLKQLAGDIETADATVQTLAASPEMRAAEALDAAHREAERCRKWRDQCQSDHDKAAARHQQAQEELRGAESVVTQADDELRIADASARTTAQQAGLSDQHEACLVEVDALRRDQDDGNEVESRLHAAASQAEQMIGRRQEAIRRVASLVRAVEEQSNQLTWAKRTLADRQSELDKAIETERAASDQVDVRGASLLSEYRTWADALTDLSPTAADDLAEAWAAWCETGEGRSPVRAAVEAALAVTARALAEQRAAVTHELDETRQQRDQLQAQREALDAGRHEPPPRPHTRGIEARGDDQAGAPLWSLIEFVDDVSAADRAGLEAALEAGGLLDAWVTPDGRLLDARTQDTSLTAANAPLPENVPRLIDVIRPDVTAIHSAKVAEHVVRDVLSRIGIGEGKATTWVDPGGAWRNGPLRGRWLKPAAQHIGQAARERYRLEQIADLEARIAEADAHVQKLHTSIDRIDQRDEGAQKEAQRAPSDEPVRQALAERVAASKHVANLHSRVAEAESHVSEQRQALKEAEAERDRDAEDLGLSDWVDRLDDLREAVNEYRQAVGQLWPALRRDVETRGQMRRTAEQVRELSQQLEDQVKRLEGAASALRQADARRAALEASIGQSARDIRARLDEARQHATTLRKQEKQANDEHTSISVDLGVAQNEITTHTESLERHQHERSAAVESLASFVRLGLMGVVSVELAHADDGPTSVTRAVELARRIESLLAEAPGDDETWAKHQREVHRHIQALTDALLPHDLRPQTTTIDNMLVVSVIYNQRECGMPELRSALAEDAQARRTLLEERERQVLEQTLIDEVAAHLHDRLHGAERLVADMNEQVTSRPMSTGMRIKFAWEPIDDGPPGLLDARRRLLSAGATWPAEDRAALGQFLHEQIQTARAANETATWQEHIEEAFDYRQWHRFGVMRQQDGKWQRLTRRTHGTGSGGEKAVALTLPMFAAAAAHYQSADALAPRPILLDEVFAGIDSDMRGKCMGLLDAFDLDFIMTSEREWGCYAEMPGVAIYQLTTMKGIDGVLATRWLWNGRQLHRSETPARQDEPVSPSSDGNGALR